MLLFLFDGKDLAVRTNVTALPAVGDIVKAKGVAYVVEAITGQAQLQTQDGERWRSEPATKLRVRRFDPFEALAAELPL